jgi:membrane associated rhomboid family serine protease
MLRFNISWILVIFGTNFQLSNAFSQLKPPRINRTGNLQPKIYIKALTREFVVMNFETRLKTANVERTTSLTDVIIVLNVAIFLAQITSAFAAHIKITEVLTRRGHYAFSPFERGLPFSVPQYAFSMGGKSISGQGLLTLEFILNPTFATRFGQVYRCITSAFLHGSMFHVGLNMWNMNNVGRRMEAKFGPWLLGCTYILSALAASAAHILFSPRSSALGASGAVMGLYGFLWLHYRRQGDDDQANYLLRYMASVVIFGFLTPGTANAAHIGGFLGGGAIAWLCAPRNIPKNNKLHWRDYTWEERRRNNVAGGSHIPMSYLLLASLLIPGVFDMLWQVPCAAHLHATKPGALARGASPATALPVKLKPVFGQSPTFKRR